MKGRSARTVWPVVALSIGALVVLVFLVAFVWRLFHPPVTPFVESDDQQHVILLDIVNASGKNGAGRSTMTYLRERGFDVVEISTGTELAARTMVIDRMGDRQSALKVAKVLGVSDSMVVSQIDSMLFVRASVILGKDLLMLTPFADS